MPARPWATEADYTAGSSSLDGKTSLGRVLLGLCVQSLQRPPQVLCWDCVYKVSKDHPRSCVGIVCTESPPHDEELLVNGPADRKHNAHVVKRCR